MKQHLNTRFRLRRLLCFALVLAMLPLSALTVHAEGEYTRTLSVRDITVTAGGRTLEDVYSDPVSYYEVTSGGDLTDYEIRFTDVAKNDTVIYTALYPYTTTGRTGKGIVEYTCEPEGTNFVVTKINTAGDGTTYIPVGGFVLSVTDASFAQIGDKLTLGGNTLRIPTKAVESSAGKRIAVDYTNVNRASPMVVYYDYQYGTKTGTNVYGTEMTCVYDFESNSFKVEAFRGFGMGDASGSVIPDNSFVLSAYGEGYRALLSRGELFDLGDEVTMVGFDFIRFGNTVVGTYDFIDPTPEENPAGMETETSPFPAYRGTDQTIIYRDGWSYNDAAGTGTNVYGYEAAIDAEGTVVEVGVNVSAIPEGGYVISGHGKGRDFIRSNMVLGATVVLDETAKTYSITTTLNSYYENLVTAVNAAITVAQNRIKQLYDVDAEQINAYIAQVEAALAELKGVKETIEAGMDTAGWSDRERQSKLMTYNNYQLEVEQLQYRILAAAAESAPVSARGVWHRPTETTYQQIEETVQLYSKVGINMVFVETLYNGYSTFRSNSTDFPYNPNLAQSYTAGDGTAYGDYLTAFAACCKEYGIEVHAWVENFYVGLSADVPVVANHPDWVMRNDDGTIYQRNEGGAYIFLDPVNREVQDCLINYYNEMFQKVPGLAGLNLDYIRYPVTDEAEDSGYTFAAMEAFAAEKGMTFSDAQKADWEKMAKKFKQLFDYQYLEGGEEEAAQNRADWVSFRANTVTEFVRRIKTEVKDTNGILLSTSVFSSVTESLQQKKQDWKTWFSNGWIDIATPMAYYTDASNVLTNVTAMIQSAGKLCYYYAGLASSYSGLPAYQNKEHIEAAYLAGSNGYVIFCSTQIIGHEDVQQVLTAGVNSSSAILPHAALDEVLDGYFDAILDRAQRLYIPAGGMSEQQYSDLAAKFEQIRAMSTDGAVNIYKIQKNIQELYGLTGTSYAKGYSGQRLVETLKEIVELMDTRISLALVADGQWDPEADPIRPTVSENGIDQPGEDDQNATAPGGNTNTPSTGGDADSNMRNMLIILGICVVVMLLTGVAMFQMARSKRGPEDEKSGEKNEQ